MTIANFPATATPVSAVDRYRPRFHFTAPQCWINDPNGICFHEGRYHLYYQHNPNGSRWGDIVWGHTTSADLVHWQDEPIALVPTPGPDAGGCFSGSFAVVNGVPTLYYTGYTPQAQTQCIATSSDLQHWLKAEKPCIATPPAGVSPEDFRDPYVFRHEGRWYMVLGASLHGERGQCLLYRSDNGHDWEYRHPLLTSDDLTQGRMWECPNFFPVGDKWVLIVSLWPNLGAHHYVGRFENECFIPEYDQALDSDGGAFAPLSMPAPDGRVLQWAWLNEQREQAQIDADGWAGAMSVPRVIGVDAHGQLTQAPADEMRNLRGAPLLQIRETGQNGTLARFAGRHLDIELSFVLQDALPVGLTVLASPDGCEQTRIVYHPKSRRLVIERARSSLNAGTRRQDLHAHVLLVPGEALNLRVLVDASVLEVFANERLCMSTRVYPERADSQLASVFVEGQADVALVAWPMAGIYAAGARQTQCFAAHE